MCSGSHRRELSVLTTRDTISSFECWSLTPSNALSTAPGLSGAMSLTHEMGHFANVTYQVGYPRSGADHQTHVPHFSMYLSGHAEIIVPNGDKAIINSGGNRVILVLDTMETSSTGHFVEYPSHEETVCMNIPTKDGQIPEHRVLYDGPCTMDTVDFTRRGLAELD
ncbi:hypothetical protein NEOLEDRAFT_1137014 [Neolentinus lepideus HHB14362 ss-1]|uniref:Uncharacterized protein n=1 Tax=Neolentinus lepideus HHB14362 ss-1 TaxID=1314782 RepID=A0A165R0D6_9AGAM|nr:hypothetical protein NEOLEDRAFT_1137014 [Neolentinus lepideus HHB14362 ss-1]